MMAASSRMFHFKVVGAGVLYRFGKSGFGLRSDLGNQAMRGYSVVAAKVDLSAGSILADPKQTDDKVAAGYRATSWMPDPVTGYYMPEDHFGEFTAVAEHRLNVKAHSTTRREAN
nr:late embryogenesis abundant protein LEA85 [Pinus tabuliformis]